ncbi:MAG: transcriptional regulator [Microbacterium gubbeenense]|uniref:transcriptional regulator n=1 Tax=Microbacterium gubbeenense TaxID=159896 RepID=UPI000406C08D|nr:transcriptional regulator [Microbacterium gubbeenense]
MTDPQFNDLVHSPVRLRICALLRPANELEFATIRDTLRISDAHLSKNLKLLSDAGIVQLRKDPRTSNTRMRTWAALTTEGTTVVDGHLAALAQIAEGSF